MKKILLVAGVLLALASPGWAQYDLDGTGSDPGYVDLDGNGNAAAATMRDYEETANQRHSIADPFGVTGDIDEAYAFSFAVEQLPGTGEFDVVFAQDLTPSRRFFVAILPSNDGTCASCLRVQWYNGGTTAVCQANALNFGALTAGVSYFGRVQYDASDQQCLAEVNDTAETPVARTGAPGDSTADFVVGNSAATSFAYDGLAGPLLRFTTTPAEAEWTAMYNSGVALNCTGLVGTLSTGVASHCWEGDEASGNLLESAVTGNGVDLTDVNSVGSAPRP